MLKMQEALLVSMGFLSFIPLVFLPGINHINTAIKENKGLFQNTAFTSPKVHEYTQVLNELDKERREFS